jgi:hypothetical protein
MRLPRLITARWQTCDALDGVHNATKPCAILPLLLRFPLFVLHTNSSLTLSAGTSPSVDSSATLGS